MNESSLPFRRKFPDLYEIFGALLGFFLVAIILIFLAYFHIFDIRVFLPAGLSLKPSVVLYPSPSQGSATITPRSYLDFAENCTIKKENNPLIANLITSDGGIDGSILGTITNYFYSPANKVAQIEVLSVHGDQSHTFHLAEAEGLVFDESTQTPKTLTALSLGQAVALSFQCDTYTNNTFTVTRVSLLKN